MRNLVVVIILLFSVISKAQEFEPEVVQKMSDDTCSCLESIEPSEDNQENIKSLQKCMLEQVFKNIIYLKENGLDINEDRAMGKRLGTQIGLKLASGCEAALPAYTALGMASLATEDSEEQAESEELPFFIGKITDVEKGTFPIFKITDVDGVTHNVLWLTIVDNPALFQEALKGKKNFILEYYENELYDDRIKEYRYMKVLNAVKTQ